VHTVVQQNAMESVRHALCPGEASAQYWSARCHQFLWLGAPLAVHGVVSSDGLRLSRFGTTICAGRSDDGPMDSMTARIGVLGLGPSAAPQGKPIGAGGSRVEQINRNTAAGCQLGLRQ